ncbi:hypothetical protein DYB30_013805 [Aphanomyces astaci]|uniref:Uncharacterized protein n=1 Tax=Aphanomyces astaci TaxID=112090 RepID=A0A397CBU1_APHAT|nr:hypothetical protein DYB30_013805 [Aphanomyces astaci]RHZ15545.1 hypothetical protein DYB26_007804 [Aphanomyces astaci]
MKAIFALLVAAVATSSALAACSKTQIRAWKQSCDRLPTDQQKCDSRTCHRALHWLTDPETRTCYVSLGLGPASDLNKYITLDEFCHASDVHALGLEFAALVKSNSN